MTAHPRASDQADREGQMADALKVMREAYDMGCVRVTVELTRHGTFRVVSERAGDAKVAARSQFGTGLKR